VKKFWTILLAFACAQAGFGQLSGPLSGTLGPGTYHIVGDISVQGSDSLTLMPGTIFTFDSLYEFHIHGTLLAEGTESDSIVFTTDTVANPARWRGLRFDGGSSGSRLAYCLIENGHRTGGQPNNYGGGVYCTSSSPIFTHCVIRNNSGEEGGGVYCTNSSASFTECTISGNSTYAYDGGGLACTENSSPILTNCTISDNHSNLDGGGLSCRYGSSPIITSCIISDNTSGRHAGGLNCDTDSSPIVTHCTISGNLAESDGGGLYCYDSEPNFIECTISRNSSDWGGGMHCTQASPIFTNCTISHNSAENQVGAVSCSFSSPTFNSTIITFSEGEGIWFRNSAESQFKYCDIFGNSAGNFGFYNNDPSQGPPGIGELVAANANGDSCDTYLNILLNPMFVDTAASDYHLLAGSPCIDAGDPAVLPDPDYTVVEIGAFYFPQQPIAFFVSPDSLDFGLVLYRGDSTLSFWIHNPTQNMLQVAGIRATDTLIFHATPTSVQIPPMDSVEIELTFSPRRNISYLDSVQIAFAGLDEAETVVIQGTGFYDCHVLDGIVNGILSVDCSPYYVAGKVTIEDGDTLTIEAGVEMIFDCHCQLVVNGLLSAIGTEQDSIRFTCDAVFNPDHWGGLRFDSAHDSCRLEYCVIEKGQAEGYWPDNIGGGVYCGSSSPSFAHCAIRDNWSESDGGAVHCRNGSSLAFTHCNINGNSSDRYGGGLYCVSSSLAFANCIISDNSASGDGGGMQSENTSLTFTNCTISDNSAGGYGGGINLYGSAPTLTFTNCDISGNVATSYGGGMRCGGASPSLDSCTISSNTGSQGGGIFFSSSSSSLMHCVINDNTAGYAAGVFCAFSSDTFTNCTITGNSVQNDGGGVYCRDASPVFNSTIISFSNGDGIYLRDSPASVFKYCDIFGNSDGDITFRDGDPLNGPAGIGELTTTNANSDSCDTYYNIFLNPMFVDTAASDYHLLAGSPCIDAGDPTLPLDPDSSIADIGVFRFEGHAPLSFDLLSPADGDTVDTLEVTLMWAPSSDPDPGDSIAFYRVYLALDSAFSTSLDSQDVSTIELAWGDLQYDQMYWWRVKAFDTQGFGTSSNQIWSFHISTSAISDEDMSLPREFALCQNYPNPFNPTTTFKFGVPRTSHVNIRVYNILGRQVATLADGMIQAGHHQVTWNCGDCSSGVYLVVMSGDGFNIVRKATLIR